MKKICMLVSEHSFLDHRIFLKEAVSLRRAGYNVTMIVPRVLGFLFDINGSKFKDTFLEKDFYYRDIHFVTYEKSDRRMEIEEVYKGIHEGTLEKQRDELTELALSIDADVYHAHEFSSLVSAIKVKRQKGKNGCSVIYDAHELLPEPHHSKYKIFTELVDVLLQEVDTLITVSESIASYYRKFNSLLPVEVIYNSPPYNKEYMPKLFKNNVIEIVHEGFIEKSRGNWSKMINVLDKLQHDLDLTFTIIGGDHHNQRNIFIPPRLKKYISLRGWVPAEEIPKHMMNAHLGWIDLNVKKSLNYYYAMPNKFFSYLNNGLPVVVNDCLDMKRFIEKHQCGICIPSSNATAAEYADAIRKLASQPERIEEMSYNARNTMKKYSWERMELRLLDIYKCLV